MRSSDKRKVLITILVICIVLIICGAGYFLIKNNFGGDNTASTDKTEGTTLSGIYKENADIVHKGLADNPIDFDQLIKENKDVYSWIYVPDTNINYPVLQSDLDDNLYLDHDIYKDYSFPGAIYSQSMNHKDYSDRVTVLYGHNMLDGSMFANIYKFMDDDFFDSHKEFYVYTPDRKLTYSIVSVFEYDDRHIMNSFDFSKDSVFNDWLTMIKNPHTLYSKINKDVKLDLNSKILVLSTCTNSGDGRLLLQGVMKKDERTK